MAVKKFKALGAYIFAGGFTLGVREHFEILTHFEEGPYGVETAIHNGLIKEAHIDPSTWPVKQYSGKVDFLYSNPPCAPWSLASAGRATHWTEDPRINAVKRVYGLLEQIKPDVWVWESVRPTWVKGRMLVETVAKAAMAQGYSATVLMVDASLHGVPQTRKRFFLVLHKNFIDWEPSGQKRMPVVRDKLKGKFKTQTCANAEPNQLKLLKKMKPGERLHNTFERLNPDLVAQVGLGKHVPGRPSFQRARLQWDRIGYTLTGGPHFFHPDEPRLISVEESAALCGYPRDFKFIGGTAKQYAQVAQAVMPPVAEYLARQVRQSLEDKKKIRKPFFERVEIFADDISRELLLPPSGTMSLKVEEQPKKPKIVHINKRAALNGTPRRGIGRAMRELLDKGLSDDKVLTIAKKEFPESKATIADVRWNRGHMKEGGKFFNELRGNK